MTKKSASRVQRDEFKKDNTAWEDLRNLYLTNQSALNTIVTSVKSFFEVKDIGLFIPMGERKYASEVIDALAEDVKNFQTRLNEIYDQHKSMNGKFDFNDTDYVRLISLGDQYVNFTQDFQTVLDPMYKQALGIMASIEQNIARIVAQEDMNKQNNTSEEITNTGDENTGCVSL